MAEFIQKYKLFSSYSGLMIIIVLIAIFAPWLAPGDAFTSNISQALQAPRIVMSGNTALGKI